MTSPLANPHAELEERLCFETLIADLSSEFVNLPPADVDREIVDAERRICDVLGVDVAGLWQWSNEFPGPLLLTHLYGAVQAPIPEQMNASDYFPWYQQQMLAGRVASFSALDVLPAEAARDRESYRSFGIKSNVTIPLSVGGGRPIGALGFNTTRAERDWPDALVKRLQLVAQIFANALARKRSDQALRESQARLAAGTDLAGLGYYEVDYGQRSCFVDERFRDICGVPKDLQEGLAPVQFWTEHVHPDDYQLLSQEREKLHGGKVDRICAEYRYRHPLNGDRWLHHSARFAGPSATGGAIRTYGVVRDITPQKQAELETQGLRDNLAHAGRVTLLGQLASALAHELSQPLGAILRNAEAAEIMLQDPAPDLEELRAIVSDILKDDQRAGLVIDRLRSLLKRGSLDLQRIEMQSVIAEVLSLIHADAAARHVGLAFTTDPGLPAVRGDRVHLQQVLLNLLVNAMDALDGCAPNRRQVQVSVRRTDPAGVEVRVSDNGPGIPGHALAQLFEPFFTTKAKGMGMGLPVSRTIIEAHKGRLWAENGPGGGACFCFMLPVAAGEGER